MARTRERKFRAETSKLLDLMIHSVYREREVFLRELISNASDAIDKARIEDLTGGEGPRERYEIRLVPDAEAGTLTVRDQGIGMTDEEVVENLGTIAHSGTEAFQAATAGDGVEAADLIGRFGIGFYSAFMVADKVEVLTCRAGADHAVRWLSEGGDSYEIQKLPPTERGTSITLHLRPDARGEAREGAGADGEDAGPPEDFTDPATLRAVVARHSDYVAHPIVLQTAGGEDGEGLEDTLNSMTPLWTRPEDEVDEQELADFYRHVSHDWTEPLATVRVKAEGLTSYTSLLFVPGQAPPDLYTREHRQGLQLFVRRVMVMEECRELMPPYLRFVRGVLDTPDLAPSLSREVVQSDRRIAAIRRHLSKRVLDEMAGIQRDDPERYARFWEAFGPVLLEGFHYEPQQAERLRALTLARSTADEGWTSLADYVARMPEGQDAIWYLLGEDARALRGAPQLEAFRAKGVEVLLLESPVEELALEVLGEHEGRPFRSAARDQVDLSGIGVAEGDETDEDEAVAVAGEAEATAAKADPAALAALVGRLSTALEGEVSQVRESTRLRASAACLVDAEGAPSASAVRMMQALGQDMPTPQRVLEINPGHPLVARLAARAALRPDDPRLASYARLLYDQALVAEGQLPEDPAAFAGRLAELMAWAAEGGGGADGA